jgi:hypothetical protein
VRTLKCETTLSSNLDSVPTAKAASIAETGAWSVFWQAVVSLFGILQIIFGTAVFSWLLYIGIWDATIFLMRYAGSALVCRLIMYLEIEGTVMVAQGKRREV